MILIGLLAAVACGGIAALLWANPVPNSFEPREQTPEYVEQVTRGIAVLFGIAAVVLAVVSL